MSLQLCEVQIGYGKKIVVHGASLCVGTSEIVTLLGPNGAGKTTLLNGIFGVAHVHSGRVEWNGSNIVGQRPAGIVRAGICYAPQGAQVYPSMTVAENLLLGSYAAGNRRAAEADIRKGYELFPILYERRKGLAGSLSGGERQMLALAAALAGGPRLILLDEPSGGLAPLVVEMVFDAVYKLSSEFGVSVLLVEQNLHEALRIAHRAYVLSNGRITAVSERSEFARGSDRLEAAFFGTQAAPNGLAQSEILPLSSLKRSRATEV
jgi:branched-chain amino acid transport system ATP-binding protein